MTASNMGATPFQAIAYLKAEVPGDDPARLVNLDEENAPVVKQLGRGLLVAYLVDEGDRFSYVQGRDLRATGIDASELHDRALANLATLAEGRVTLRRNGPARALFLDGNFEASLILLDDLWNDALRDEYVGEPVVAIPTRDVLCFCDSSSVAGIAELRAVVNRLWPGGDHLVSDKLFRRRNRAWELYQDVA